MRFVEISVPATAIAALVELLHFCSTNLARTATIATILRLTLLA